jgi:hypothetical protein
VLGGGLRPVRVMGAGAGGPRPGWAAGWSEAGVGGRVVRGRGWAAGWTVAGVGGRGDGGWWGVRGAGGGYLGLAGRGVVLA